MNAYADLTRLKSPSYLNIESVADYDAHLLILLEMASRLEDDWCKRSFYVRTETRYYDGAGTYLFLPDDLLSITTLKTDEDGDGTYENSFETTDYHLYPLNAYPKTLIRINPNGDYSSFAAGIPKGVQLVGSFGYGDSATPYYASGTTTNEELDATETGVDVADGSVFSIGQTILVESEQMYVTGIATNTLTVRRGVNGTTGATHATGKAVSIYEYPAPIVQACLITAMRAFKRKDSSYQDVVGSPETGQVITSKGIDPDVVEILKAYRRVDYP